MKLRIAAYAMFFLVRKKLPNKKYLTSNGAFLSKSGNYSNKFETKEKNKQKEKRISYLTFQHKNSQDMHMIQCKFTRSMNLTEDKNNSLRPSKNFSSGM